MNPYLEHPDRWSTVHNRLIVTLAERADPALPQYQVDIERIYKWLGSTPVGRADVSVQRPHTSAEAPTNLVVAPSPTEPVKVTVPDRRGAGSVSRG